MTVIRQDADYALRAMGRLAAERGGSAVAARRLAAETGVSPAFLSKIMQRLHEAKLVSSTMGPKGGFCLGRAAARITLLEVIEAVQGPLAMNTCLTPNGRCPRQSGCAVHTRLDRLQQTMRKSLHKVTLAQLAAAKDS